MQGRNHRGRDAVVIARGYAIKVRVDSGHLLVQDGIGEVRERRYPRAKRPGRLMILGQGGYVSLDALRWCHEVGTEIVHLTQTESGQIEVICTSVARSPDLPALRRSQALAADGPAGIEIARHVLMLKVADQRDTLGLISGAEDARAQLDRWVRRLEHRRTITGLLEIEAGAAADYWRAWEQLPVPLATDGRRQVPEHWRTFGGRASTITGSPRAAINPANAALNFVYSLLRAETILSCHALGLDPGIGIFHRDREGRESLADDLVESVRPIADAYTLTLFTERKLSVRDFQETREGACRISPRLTASLAETTPVWRAHVAPVVEWTANLLGRHAASAVPLRTPLSQAQRRAALDERAPARRRRAARPRASLPNACRQCGQLLHNGRDRLCEGCRRARMVKQAAHSRHTVADLAGELRDALAEQLWEALRDAGSIGMSRTQVRDLFNRNVDAERIDAALAQLRDSGRARSKRVRQARGRPTIRWIALPDVGGGSRATPGRHSKVAGFPSPR
jgi:CRISP-associated protein Cas1